MVSKRNKNSDIFSSRSNKEQDKRYGNRKDGFKEGENKAKRSHKSYSQDKEKNNTRRGERKNFMDEGNERKTRMPKSSSSTPSQGREAPSKGFNAKGFNERGSRKEGFGNGPKNFSKTRDRGGRDSYREKKPYITQDEQDCFEISERIAKRLARSGIASRRDAEMMIALGRISVNGEIIKTPALNVKRSDKISVDGKELPQAERTRLWLYHKPAGLVTTSRDPEGRPTVFDNLPEELPRTISVGRLDINTEGLLLLTNDGGLARILELPATGWARCYKVRAHGKVQQEALDDLKNGIAVDGVFYGAVEAQIEREQGSNVWLNITLREGKNREVKNILGALGLSVNRLIRVAYGPFQLLDLEAGAVREIKGRVLRDQLGERLIEEANADFDAPLLNISSTKIMPKAKTLQSFHKEKFGEEGQKKAYTPRERGSNVWIAPGARPMGAKKRAALLAKQEENAPREDRTREDRPRRDALKGERSKEYSFRENKSGRDKSRQDRSRGDGFRDDRPKSDRARYGKFSASGAKEDRQEGSRGKTFQESGKQRDQETEGKRFLKDKKTFTKSGKAPQKRGRFAGDKKEFSASSEGKKKRPFSASAPYKEKRTATDKRERQKEASPTREDKPFKKKAPMKKGGTHAHHKR